jgi:hypothetical protein
VLVWAALGAAVSAAPAITNISPRSLAVGGTTVLTIDGTELSGRPRVLLPIPIESQEVKGGGTANRVQIEVKLPPSIAAGIRPLRIAAESGISAQTPISVDELTAVPFTSALSSLPAAMYGELTGGTVLRTSFRGGKGERFVAEIESRRLGSALTPILRLLNERGVQIAWADEEAALAGDARLETTLPGDGDYTIELHDAYYRGGAPGMFRLKVGDFRYADLTLPLAVQRGTIGSLELVRSNLSRMISFDAKGQSLGPQFGPFAGQSPSLATTPRLLVSDHAEIVEPAGTDGPHAAPAGPVGISGRLSREGEEDRYKMPVTSGAALRFDVLAERAGSPVDAVLSIRNEQGQQLAAGDDRPGTTDPGLDFTVPGGVSTLVVAIRDLHRRGGRDFIYRLSVKPASHPDFALAMPQDTVHIPRGGRVAVRVQATRQGHAGAILLEDVGLPPGVEMFPREIPARADAGIVVFEAKPSASGQALSQLQGRASYDLPPRPALGPQTAANAMRPWDRASLGVAVAPAAAAVTVDWADGAAPTAHQGRQWPATIRATRVGGAAGPIRLTLLTTQTIPKKNQNNQQVDDVARALRLADGVTIPADKSDAQIKLVVPGDLPMIGYDLVIQADLLSPDAKQTIATTYTRPRRLSIVPPPQAPEPKS